MPFDGNKWSFKKMVSYMEMLDTFKSRWPDLYRIQDHPNDTSKVNKYRIYHCHKSLYLIICYQ